MMASRKSSRSRLLGWMGAFAAMIAILCAFAGVPPETAFAQNIDTGEARTVEQLEAEASPFDGEPAVFLEKAVSEDNGDPLGLSALPEASGPQGPTRLAENLAGTFSLSFSSEMKDRLNPVDRVYEVYWDDAWFNGSSSQYNGKLAIAAMGLSFSAYRNTPETPAST